MREHLGEPRLTQQSVDGYPHPIQETDERRKRVGTHERYRRPGMQSIRPIGPLTWVRHGLRSHEFTLCSGANQFADEIAEQRLQEKMQETGRDPENGGKNTESFEAKEKRGTTSFPKRE